MNNTLISVIVPIYKVEPYIRRCVESIIAQTHKCIEIILVDDGSPDNCGAICDEYACLDNRIIVIHKKNGGLSSARNVALDIAKGEYLMFVDGDDWVEPNFCATALKLALDNDVQVVSFGYNKVYYDKDYKPTGIVQKMAPSESCIMNASDAVRHIITKDFVMYNFVWNKLYKRSLWCDIKFPEGKLYEDQFVTYFIIIKAGKVYVTPEVLYNYIQRSDSIMKMIYTPKAIADRFSILQDRLNVIRNYCPENEPYQMMQLAHEAIIAFAYIPTDSDYCQTLSDMHTFLSVNKKYLMLCEGYKKTRIKLLMYYYCRPLLLYIKLKPTVKLFHKHRFKIKKYDTKKKLSN